MNISYTGPLSRAWNRMKRMLFRPFHIETWFVLGASAFLAGLFRHMGSPLSWSSRGWTGHGRTVDVQTEQALEHVRERLLHFLDNPIVLFGIMAGLLIFCVCLVVLAWVAARSEFVFLDCVATRRARFGEPWSRTARQGHSLFLWRAAFSFAYLPPILLVVLPFAGTLISYLNGQGLSWPSIAAMVLGISTAALMLVVIAWISLLMDAFVVPLMYRYGEGSRAAWARFWPLLRDHFGTFLAYGIYILMLTIAVGIGLGIAGVGTCCIGLVLMLIPYIGSVLLLPVLVTARALGPEFMAQFGPEWQTFPPEEAEEEPEPAPAPAPVV